MPSKPVKTPRPVSTAWNYKLTQRRRKAALAFDGSHSLVAEIDAAISAFWNKRGINPRQFD